MGTFKPRAFNAYTYDRDTSWVHKANCIDSPIEWWAPPSLPPNTSVATTWRPDPRAYALCDACPVAKECLADARASGDIEWVMRAKEGPESVIKIRQYRERQKARMGAIRDGKPIPEWAKVRERKKVLQIKANTPSDRVFDEAHWKDGFKRRDAT